MKAIFFSFLILGAGLQLQANEIFGKVINVIDGNTLTIIGPDNKSEKYVLAGVDSPEPGQEHADKAKRFLEKLLLNENVSVQVSGKDRLGNYIAIVMKGDVDPRVELLKEGLAWTAEKNPIPELEVHRMKAKEKGRGLWKIENPTPPWIYRRQQSMMEAKGS